MDKEYIKKAANEFGAELSVAEKYGDYFFNKIKPKIKRKFLSHLISSVEDMINEKRKSANNINGLRLYSISLLPITLKKRATTRFFDNGAFIFYNDVYIGKQAQLLIAHELGHIVNKELFEGQDNEANANMFAFISISDKNEFYLNECKNYTYKGKEIEIINEIKNVCC